MQMYKQILAIAHTVCIQIFEGCNFRGFHGQPAIREILILEISLAKLWLISQLASIGEQGTCEQLHRYISHLRKEG